jgi:hypothetical protein
MGIGEQGGRRRGRKGNRRRAGGKEVKDGRWAMGEGKKGKELCYVPRLVPKSVAA